MLLKVQIWNNYHSLAAYWCICSKRSQEGQLKRKKKAHNKKKKKKRKNRLSITTIIGFACKNVCLGSIFKQKKLPVNRVLLSKQYQCVKPNIYQFKDQHVIFCPSSDLLLFFIITKVKFWNKHYSMVTYHCIISSKRS